MVQVTCLGEALAVLVPVHDSATPEHGGRGYTLEIGGAEANVACTLAALGVSARWVGRLGDDHFGRVVLRTLAEHGVDVSAVEVDSTRQTGLYVKEIARDERRHGGGPGTRMRYYRAGSAACAMTPGLAQSPALTGAGLVHVSGITPALSESCAALVDAVLAAPRPGRPVSFDVNLRPALWTGRDPAVLLDLAGRADLVFAGADETEAICGVSDPDELRRMLPGPRTLVVKQGAAGAVGFEAGQRVHVPAQPVEVVEATGAGDAFAAGFIAATLRGLPLRDRLRLGAFAAAGALRVRGDLGVRPDAGSVERFLSQEPEPTPDEVRTGAA
ncbi:MAG: sugar kinase [Actinocrinis sp.]